MSRQTEREIARRLAEMPTAEPPAELLDRLRADVPDDLAARLAAEDDGERQSQGTVVPFPSRRWLAAAATVVMLVGGGFLAWKLSRSVAPLDRVRYDGAPAAQGAPSADREAQRAPGTAGTENQRIGEGMEGGGSAAVPQEPGSSTGESPSREAGREPPAKDERERRRDESARELAAVAPSPPTARRVPAAGATATPASQAPASQAGRAAPGAQAPATATPPSAAAPSSGLVVRVLDEQADALPGATVQVQGGGRSETAFTDAEGRAEFPDLAAGRYQVEGSLDGFGTVVDQDVEVPAGTGAERELELPMGFAEEILVTGTMPQIDTSSTVAASATYDAPMSDDAMDLPDVQLAEPSMPPPPPPAAMQRKVARVPEPLAKRLEAVRARPQRAAAVPKPAPVAELNRPAEGPIRAVPDPIPAPPVNPEVETATDRLSTFGLDVDTGSFTVLRAYVEAGRLPPPAAMRVEEVVNAQAYGDPFAAAPARPDETFRLLADGAPSPFAPSAAYRLLRFRVVARDLAAGERKPVVLTLVVDISGSMGGEKLALVQRGIEQLAGSLRPEDRAALVVFSDDARLVVPHGQPAALRRAAADLATEGGTNAEAGLVLGYQVARQAFTPGASNRVMLLSDGVANIGETGPNGILARVAKEAAAGIELTTVGVGMEEYDDEMLETLADHGDGRYAYVDDQRELERLFSGELDGTLQTMAEEARAQVELDPRLVESWRQLGYENRAIADREFRYDSVDAGEIGPGHSVTALYEVKLRAAPRPGQPLALLKLRWREPAAADGTPGPYHEIETRLLAQDVAPSWNAAGGDLRLAAVAAELAEQLRRSPHAQNDLATLVAEARRLAAERPDDDRVAELAALAERAASLLAAAGAESVGR